MGRLWQLLLAALSLSQGRLYAFADSPQEDIAQETFQSPSRAVAVSASFPDAEIFGIKLINGKPTEAVLSIANDEPDPVTLKFVGGALWSLGSAAKPSQIVRNLTIARYNVEIGAGEKQSLPYKFSTELHPQDLRLELAAIMNAGKQGDGMDFAVPSFNETVSIVEPDTSIFDPRMIFLYVFMLLCAGAVLYFFYATWIAPYFQQQKRRRGGGGSYTDRSKKPTTVVSNTGGPAYSKNKTGENAADGSTGATTTGRSYNEEWIPNHHIQRPEARRVKSTPRPKSRGKGE